MSNMYIVTFHIINIYKQSGIPFPYIMYRYNIVMRMGASNTLNHSILLTPIIHCRIDIFLIYCKTIVKDCRF